VPKEGIIMLFISIKSTESYAYNFVFGGKMVPLRRNIS
jgi:hypothetical protein